MLKFKVVPKVFTTPSDTAGYTIDAIGVALVNAEVDVAPTIMVQFSFFSAGTLKMQDNKPVAKKVTITGMGDIDFFGGLLSYDKAKVYSVASLMCAKNGFTLAPMAEQVELLTM
jgi:hypothetical protein